MRPPQGHRFGETKKTHRLWEIHRQRGLIQDLPGWATPWNILWVIGGWLGWLKGSPGIPGYDSKSDECRRYILFPRNIGDIILSYYMISYPIGSMVLVYWWDPWSTIYSSTMDPMGYDIIWYHHMISPMFLGKRRYLRHSSDFES